MTSGQGRVQLLSTIRLTRLEPAKEARFANSDFFVVCSWANDSRQRCATRLKRACQMPAYHA
jgi:hypothetical protein